MLRIHSFLLLLLWYSVVIVSYRLNVPRVLLPYHPNVQVKFQLMVSDPDNGCFIWRTTRPDIVSVKVINPRGADGCSAEAQIAATSKHAEEQTAVVFAENKDAGIVLSCGVTIDVIRNIAISTTTKVLFLDAAPAKIVVQAYNSEGDMFTNLGEIPFEWHLEYEKLSEKPLRIVPFSQSKYEAPDGVRLLEENKKRGYVVLVEGISTGAAILKAKMIEPHFENVESKQIELVVVANLLLIPSQNVFVPLGSIIHYSAEIVKQSVTESIRLPSKQYYLTIKDDKICSLDSSTSEVTAISFGTTEIFLIDKNVKSLSTIKPPSVRITVVEPSALDIKISGDSWYLEKNREYHISLVVTDADDNVMYIPENAVFESTISSEHFKIISKSRNGSYFHLKAIKNGTTKLSASFVSVVSQHEERKIPTSINGEAIATISEPIAIEPSFITFPYIDNKKIHSRKLMAHGGTGSFTWLSTNPSIASVDSSGILFSGMIGETEVFARDTQNSAHFGKTIVQVLQPSSIAFGKSRVESEVGSTLNLYVSLRANSKVGEIAITDCRRVNFTLKIMDTKIFRVISTGARDFSPFGDGCSSFTLAALSSGDTTATVQFGSMVASIQISAYPPLKLETPIEALILLGSKFVVRTSGGPRPWILDSSRFYSKLAFSDASNLISDSTHDGHTVTCKNSRGDITIVIVVGNEASPTNSLPAKAEIKMRLCCSLPNRLALSLLRSNQSSCPENERTVSFIESSNIALSAFGHCESGPSMGVEKQFDSLSSLEVNWSVNDANLVQVVEDRTNPDIRKVYGILKPKKVHGEVEIVASAGRYKVERHQHSFSQKLQSKLRVNLISNAQAIPSTVVLLNEKRAAKEIRLENGSGHFALTSYDSTVLSAILHENFVKVHPLTVGKSELVFKDLCIGNIFTATISVTDVEEILIQAPEFIALNDKKEMQLKVRDVEGLFFVTDDADIMNVQLNASSNALKIIKIDSLDYILQGDTVGVATLRASARRANGRMLQSQPHSIQVYAQLQLLPKIITLIPDSVFQLEVTGGPQPLPPLRYRLNNTAVANVAANGLVTSKTVGYAEIIGTVSLDNNAIIEDRVIVKTVKLTGVRIRISTSRIQVGEKAWARIEGLADDQTPFSFGGTQYPLKISWTTTTPGIIETVSSVDALMAESDENRFQIELNALKPGQTVIHVSVKDSKNSKAFKESKNYEDHLVVTVIEPLKLTIPSRNPIALRLSPDAELDLQSNREGNSVQFMVPAQLSKHITVTGEMNNTLRAWTVGDAAVVAKEINDPYKELIYLPVSVTPVVSLHLDVEFPEISNIPLAKFPLGYRLRVTVKSRDHLGRLFDAAKHSLSYRPHRYDLIEIHSSSDNHSFDIYLKDVGETVFKVWDRSNPELSVFLRLPVDDVIKPELESMTISEIICFESPLSTIGWRELNAKRHFQFIDETSGIAMAVDVGEATVASFGPQKQTIFTKRKIIPANSLYFSSAPQFVSNIKGHRHIFPVIVSSDELKEANIYGCTSSSLESINLQAPFDCTANFIGEVNVLATSLLTAYSTFMSNSGKYACIVEEQAFEEPYALLEYQNLSLFISAVWNQAGKVKQASVTVVFYPRFEIMQREIRLNNVNALSADMIIRLPISMVNKITVETDAQNILRIEQVQADLPTALRYHIVLDINSAFLWQELLDKCNVTVKNTFTGQSEIVPVTIILHGDASKAVIRASDNLLDFLGTFLESTVFQVCISLIISTFIFLLIAHCKGYSILPYLFSSVYTAEPDNTYGVFANDRLEWRSRLASPGNRSMFSPSPNPASPFNTTKSSRSAGSPGEPLLWSVPDQSLTPTLLRKRQQF